MRLHKACEGRPTLLLLPLLLLALGLPAAFAQSAPVINGLQCPEKIVNVPAEDANGLQTDLAPLLSSEGPATYLLAPGVYPFAFVVFEGTYCLVGTGVTRSDVELQPPAGVDSLCLEVTETAQVGVQSLIWNGADSVPGPLVSGPNALLTSDDVTFERFRIGFQISGSALFVNEGTARLSNVTFSDNFADGTYGTVACESFVDIRNPQERIPSTIELNEATFVRNGATQPGGTVDVRFGCTVTFQGTTTFTDNTVSLLGSSDEIPRPQVGGAVFVSGGIAADAAARVVFEGPVCAQGNVAGSGGNFAAVLGSGVLEFLQPEKVNINSIGAPGASGSDIIIRSGAIKNGSQGRVAVNPTIVCGSESSVWVDGDYSISGPVCACNAAFVAGNSTTCNTCDNGFDAETCGCAV